MLRLAQLKARLETNGWFSSLPESVQNELIPKLVVRTFAPGEALYRQGDAPSGIFGIVSGQINTIGTAADGQLSLLSVLRAGEWTGFIGLLDGLPCPFTTIAATESDVVVLPLAAADAIFSATPERLDLLLQPLMVVLRFAYFFLTETNGRPPTQMVAQRLLDLTRCLYAAQTPLASSIEHVNQEDLAAATYLTRPTVNRILRELEAQAIVKLGYGRIEIVNVDGLFDLASGNARAAAGQDPSKHRGSEPSTISWPDSVGARQRRDVVQTALMSGALFQVLPKETQAQVLESLIFRKFKAGEALAIAGQESDGLLAIVSGQFRTLGIVSDGSRKLFGLLHPGDWTGFAAALDHKPHPLTVVASGDASAVLLPRLAYDASFKADAQCYKFITTPMMGVLRFLYDYLIETNGRAPRRLVAQRLYDLARCAYLPDQKARDFVSYLSQEDIASATGVSRPTVNRVLRDLAAHGIIRVGYGNITIKDPGALLDFGKHRPT